MCFFILEFHIILITLFSFCNYFLSLFLLFFFFFQWQNEGGVGAGAQGAGRGSQSFVNLGSSSSLEASGVIGRLRPATARLVQGFVRKVSSPLWAEAKRRTTKRLVFGESAPYFALVGVTLVSGSQQGLVTKEDELESLCCNIRVSKTCFYMA